LNDYSYDVKNSLTTNAGNHPYPYLASLIGIIINYIIILIIIIIVSILLQEILIFNSDLTLYNPNPNPNNPTSLTAFWAVIFNINIKNEIVRLMHEILIYYMENMYNK